VGVRVFPHRLRHTCATQLLNAGCRVTSIQRFLGHKELSSTMIYARAHDQTVAEDYFAAMQRVEQRLEIAPVPTPEQEPSNDDVKVQPVQSNPRAQTGVFQLIKRLELPELCFDERLAILAQVRHALDTIREDLPP